MFVVEMMMMSLWNCSITSKQRQAARHTLIDTDFIADTVCHRDCSLVCTGGTKCKACQSYRPTLRAMNSRSKKSQRTSKTIAALVTQSLLLYEVLAVSLLVLVWDLSPSPSKSQTIIGVCMRFGL